MTREEKLARAAKLRDAAIAIVRRYGTWETDGSGALKIMGARIDRIQIIYRTPFQSLPDDQSRQKYLAALHGIPLRRNLPYGLDIWTPKKVLNIEWDDRGRIQLVSFRPGQWETELITAAQTEVVETCRSQTSLPNILDK